MTEQKISSLVTGGQASAGPPLGPALGPMGVNIMEVINAINEKTKDFEGMKVPVIVSVDSDTKKWSVEVGIPSAATLVLKEVGIQKGSGTSGADLTDAEWLIGAGEYADIVASVIKGVTAAEATNPMGAIMPPRGGSGITDEQVNAVAAYVWTLSNN